MEWLYSLLYVSVMVSLEVTSVFGKLKLCFPLPEASCACDFTFDANVAWAPLYYWKLWWVITVRRRVMSYLCWTFISLSWASMLSVDQRVAASPGWWLFVSTRDAQHRRLGFYLLIESGCKTFLSCSCTKTTPASNFCSPVKNCLAEMDKDTMSVFENSGII